MEWTRLLENVKPLQTAAGPMYSVHQVAHYLGPGVPGDLAMEWDVDFYRDRIRNLITVVDGMIFVDTPAFTVEGLREFVMRSHRPLALAIQRESRDPILSR